jgi:hypothetical protein
MTQLRTALMISTVIALASAVPALAQSYPGGWGGRGPRGPWQDGYGQVATQGNAEPSKRIDVETFRAADAGDALGKGRIVVVDTPPPAPPPPEPGAEPGAPPPAYATALPGNNDGPRTIDDKLPVYEAAVVDQLAGKGYDIATAGNPQQLVEIAVSHDVVIPEEAPHKPISGEVSVGVSNRGVGYGGALMIDLSKPRKAIIATRIDVRIRDKATHRVLWEGYAQGQARMTDSGFDDTRMATRLSTVLFAKFPDGKVVQALAGADRLKPADGAGE